MGAPSVGLLAGPHCEVNPPGFTRRRPRASPAAAAGLTDALSKSVEHLQSAQQSFLLLPMEPGPVEVQQQQLFLLQKLGAMVQAWQGTRFGYSITVPLLGTMSVSITIMASLAAATTLRSLNRLLQGEWEGGGGVGWVMLSTSSPGFSCSVSNAQACALPSTPQDCRRCCGSCWAATAQLTTTTTTPCTAGAPGRVLTSCCTARMPDSC